MTDYIDRKKLKDKLNNTNILWSIKCKPKVKEKIRSLVEDICKNYLRIIDNAPSVDAVEQKYAHWIKLDEDDYEVTYKCSNCNTCFYGVVDPDDSLCNFCLTCGAKMDEVIE